MTPPPGRPLPSRPLALAHPTPRPDRAVVGCKPRPARSLDPCRQPDLFTPFQCGGCMLGTAPASPSWRQRQDVGAERRNPRLLPHSILGGWRGERGRCTGGKRVPHLPWLLFVRKGTPSCTVPPLLQHPMPPTPARESHRVALSPGPASNWLSELCLHCWESARRANQPWKLCPPSWMMRRWLCKHTQGLGG